VVLGGLKDLEWNEGDKASSVPTPRLTDLSEATTSADGDITTEEVSRMDLIRGSERPPLEDVGESAALEGETEEGPGGSEKLK
jgi:hypothetical protein